MECPVCAARVYNSLLRLEGVLAVDVALDSGLVRVSYDPEQVKEEAFPPAVAAASHDGRHRYSACILTI
jgi:copper chaperone CopZ